MSLFKPDDFKTDEDSARLVTTALFAESEDDIIEGQRADEILLQALFPLRLSQGQRSVEEWSLKFEQAICLVDENGKTQRLTPASEVFKKNSISELTDLPHLKAILAPFLEDLIHKEGISTMQLMHPHLSMKDIAEANFLIAYPNDKQDPTTRVLDFIFGQEAIESIVEIKAEKDHLDELNHRARKSFLKFTLTERLTSVEYCRIAVGSVEHLNIYQQTQSAAYCKDQVTGRSFTLTEMAKALGLKRKRSGQLNTEEKIALAKLIFGEDVDVSTIAPLEIRVKEDPEFAKSLITDPTDLGILDPLNITAVTETSSGKSVKLVHIANAVGLKSPAVLSVINRVKLGFMALEKKTMTQYLKTIQDQLSVRVIQNLFNEGLIT